MKRFIKRFTVPIPLVLALIIGGGAVYAFTSADFNTKTRSFISTSCNQALVSAKSTLANNEKATVCYNYFKSSEQDTQISSLQTNTSNLSDKSTSQDSQISSLQTTTNNLSNHESPNLRSIAGDLGPYLSLNEFYSPTLNRIVQHDGAYLTANSPNIYYQSGNCSGQGYFLDIQNNTSFQLYLWKLRTGSYYVLNMIHPSEMLGFSSMDSASGGCLGSSISSYAFPVSQVSIPFSDPIVLPLSLSY
jgi:hypothetical protein